MHLAFRLSALALLALPGAAQEQLAAAPQGSVADITALSDEFNDGDLAGWTRFDQAFGWPDKIKALDVGRTLRGSLHLEPHHSARVRELNAPFLFREVHGDFDVTARVRVRGANGAIPGGTWSLGGLMARVPDGLSAGRWAPRAENWHFITTGVGHGAGEMMIETKSTFNSYSSLKLRPAPSGWIELRLVRVGMAIIAMARPEGETEWRVRDRYYRMENNPVMQVGLIAYTTSDAVPAGPENPEVANREVNRAAPVDMILEADWIRFARPRVLGAGDWYGQVRFNPVADPNLTEGDLVRMLDGPETDTPG